MIGWILLSNKDKQKKALLELDSFNLQDRIEDLNTIKTTELDALNEKIEAWDEYLKALEVKYGEYNRLQELKLLKELLNIETQELVWEIISQDMLNFGKYKFNNKDEFGVDLINAAMKFNTYFDGFMSDYKANMATLNEYNLKTFELLDAAKYLSGNGKFIGSKIEDTLNNGIAIDTLSIIDQINNSNSSNKNNSSYGTYIGTSSSGTKLYVDGKEYVATEKQILEYTAPIAKDPVLQPLSANDGTKYTVTNGGTTYTFTDKAAAEKFAADRNISVITTIKPQTSVVTTPVSSSTSSSNVQTTSFVLKNIDLSIYLNGLGKYALTEKGVTYYFDSRADLDAFKSSITYNKNYYKVTLSTNVYEHDVYYFETKAEALTWAAKYNGSVSDPVNKNSSTKSSGSSKSSSSTKDTTPKETYSATTSYGTTYTTTDPAMKKALASDNPGAYLNQLEKGEYASGIENGPVTFTGLATLHGSKSKPEYVLNSDLANTLLTNMLALPLIECLKKGRRIFRFNNGITMNGVEDPEKLSCDILRAISNKNTKNKN